MSRSKTYTIFNRNTGKPIGNRTFATIKQAIRQARKLCNEIEKPYRLEIGIAELTSFGFTGYWKDITDLN